MTAWTMLFQARDPSTPESRAAIEGLCRAYWRPVLEYLRALGADASDAEDLVQVILADFSKAGLQQLDRSHGRLRHFFKAAARHALYNLRRDAAAAKRGGGEDTLPIDSLPPEDHPATPPELDAVFDRPWARTLFERALAALAESYALRGKSDLFEAIKIALGTREELQPYAEIGSALGVTEAQIKIEVLRLRRRLGDALRQEVACTLGPEAAPAEIEEEMRYLIATLAHERE